MTPEDFFLFPVKYVGLVDTIVFYIIMLLIGYFLLTYEFMEIEEEPENPANTEEEYFNPLKEVQ